MKDKSYSESEMKYCKQMADVMFQQIFWSIDKFTFFSWGVSRLTYMYCQEMPTLALKVSGLLHNGWIFVSLDESNDTYIVTLKDLDFSVVNTVENVYCDNLGAVIDGLVEKKPELTKEEYKILIMENYN